LGAARRPVEGEILRALVAFGEQPNRENRFSEGNTAKQIGEFRYELRFSEGKT
jgi:hypothetical protein